MSQRDFQWMTGFECSAFPQIGADELAATQHDRWWASDLVRVRDLGMTLIRYGIPWPRVNPRPHEYDWQWTDQVLDLLQTLEITPIVDLFHYGTPAWIEGGIMHPIFGEIQSWYAQAFAERYPQIVYYLPTSEPYVCATFGAEFALWHPFLRGPRNAARAIKNVTEGLCRSMLAIRRVRPEALLVVADTCEYYQALDDALPKKPRFARCAASWSTICTRVRSRRSIPSGPTWSSRASKIGSWPGSCATRSGSTSSASTTTSTPSTSCAPGPPARASTKRPRSPSAGPSWPASIPPATATSRWSWPRRTWAGPWRTASPGSTRWWPRPARPARPAPPWPASPITARSIMSIGIRFCASATAILTPAACGPSN